MSLNHEYRLAVMDPFGDNAFSFKYTKNVRFWIIYCPDTWNYDAKVKALVTALWWVTTLLHVNNTECGCSLNFNGVLMLLNGVTKVCQRIEIHQWLTINFDK